MKKWYFAFFLAILLGGCSESFDREDAILLIAQADEINRLKSHVVTHSGVYEEGVSQGLWESQNQVTVFSDKAALEIRSINGNRLTLQTPIGISIEVTGMRDVSTDPDVKATEFNWSYSDLPPLVKRFAVLGGSGAATFAKYDDGWRLNNISLNTSDAPTPLADSEISAVKKDISDKNKKVEALKNEIRASFSQVNSRSSDQYMDTSGTWGYELNDNDVRFLDTLDGKLQALSIVWLGNISIREFKGMGVDIQSLTTCRYSSIFKRTPSNVSSGDLVARINEKKAAWDAKYGHLDKKFLNDTYCSEHTIDGFAKN